MDDWKLKARTVVKLEKRPNMFVSLFAISAMFSRVLRSQLLTVGYPLAVCCSASNSRHLARLVSLRHSQGWHILASLVSLFPDIPQYCNSM